MLLRSFRVRLMLWTLLVSGLVLVAFVLGARIALYRIKIQAIDERMMALAMHEFPHPMHLREWERYERFIGQISNRILVGDVRFAVYDAKGRVRFHSLNWEDVELVGFPEAEGELEAFQEEGFRRMPPGFEFEEELRDRFRGGGASGMRLPGGGRRGNPMGRFEPPKILPTFSSHIIDGSLWRCSVYKAEGYNVVVCVELSGTMADLGNVQRAFVFALPVALILLGLGAWIFASRAIKPIRKLRDTAGSISARDLSRRIPREKEDVEFAELINVFNGMLERLERSFQQANRFSADAAHELKTPLTILQGHLEVELQKADAGSESQQTLRMLLEESQRLKSITRKLLLLARADAGELALHLEETDLDRMIRDHIEDARMYASHISFSEDLDTGVVVSLDRSLITQVVQNLLNNAVKYNRSEGGKINVRLKVARGGAPYLDVENTGDSIPAEMRGQLFDRFIRVDSARNRAVEGVGLGLSLAREFMRAHGGEIELLDASPEDATGSAGLICFRVTFPA